MQLEHIPKFRVQVTLFPIPGAGAMVHLMVTKTTKTSSTYYTLHALLQHKIESSIHSFHFAVHFPLTEYASPIQQSLQHHP